MISRLLLPSSCVRLATYSCVRRSRRIRARQIMYSARLASRFPPRLRRCRTTLPEEASMGETPHRLAKEASLLNLWGLSPATISSVAAWSVPMPGKQTNSGATCATNRASWASSSAISAERASYRRATERSATRLGSSPHNHRHSWERPTLRRPTPLARLSRRLRGRTWRYGAGFAAGASGAPPPAPRFPWPSSGGRVRPRSCWCLLPQHTSRGQSPPPSTGAFRNPSSSLARSTRPGVYPDGLQPPPHGSRGVYPRPRSPRPRCPAFRRRSSSRLQLLSMSRSPSTRAAGENGRYCEGSHHRRAPMRSRRSGPGRPSGDTEVSGRRVTCKAPLAHVEGGSGRSEALPTAILKDTHSVEGEFCEVYRWSLPVVGGPSSGKITSV